jgi:hypothetical protein
MVVFLREIVFDRGKSGVSDEERLVACIQDAIRAQLPEKRIVTFEEFGRLAFPDLARAAWPRRHEYLGILLADAEFRKRIAPLGLRHIIFVGGVTETRAQPGTFVCVIGPGGGCLGVKTWDERSELAASIVDLMAKEPARRLRAEARGTSWFALVAVVPLGMSAATVATACAEMGRRVVHALAAAQGR